MPAVSRRKPCPGWCGTAGTTFQLATGWSALAGANSFTEFSERLSRDGVLVRPRMSTLDPEEITGYSVALRATGVDAAGVEPVRFGGGKLAPDLTFPQLQAH